MKKKRKKPKPTPAEERTLDLVREVLRDVIALEPCHITGMHDPTHTPRYVCRDQKAEAYDRLVAFLGLTENQIPRRLHEDCYWCHGERGNGDDREMLALWVERGTQPGAKALALAFLRDTRRRDTKGQPRYWSLDMLASNLHLKNQRRLRRVMVELARRKLVTEKLIPHGKGMVTGYRATGRKGAP